MFEFIEELAAITSEAQLVCKKCGFILDDREAKEINETGECPKCGEKD